MSRQSERKSIKREAQRLLNSLKVQENSELSVERFIKNSIIERPSEINIRGRENAVQNYEIPQIVEEINSPQQTNSVPRNTFKEFLKDWTIKHCISTKAANELLQRLKQEGHDIPSDIRTIKETPRFTNIEPMEEGLYFHYGLKNCLTDFLYENEDSLSKMQVKELKHVQNRILQHFTEEFVSMKRTMERTLRCCGQNLLVNSKLKHWPLSNSEDVLELEKIIADDEEAAKDLAQMYERQCSDCIKNFINNNLKNMFGTDKLASQFSWTNTNNNIPVKNYKCIQILKDSCLKKIPQTNYQTAEEIIKKFFNAAKDKENKSNKRKLKEKQDENNQNKNKKLN